MTLRASELQLLCLEIEQTLGGLPVHKVVQPDEDTVLIQLRGRWLVLSASAKAGRIHLLSDKPAGSGESAPAFCMLLRKHLVNARLGSVRAVEGERACELELVTATDTPRLRLFLFGAAAQLQIVAQPEDGDEPRVLDTIGPARKVHASLPAPHPAAAAIQELRYRTSAEVEAAYGEQLHRTAVEAARRKLARKLTDETKRLVRLRDHLLADVQREARAAARHQHADLILAHLHEIPRGADKVELPDDFSDGSLVEISLDPARSARANAERMYHEHRRLQRAQASIAEKLAATLASLERLQEQHAALLSETDEAVLAIARPLEAEALQRADRLKTAANLPYKTFRSLSGMPIFVGRGAKKNDELTFRVARGNDLWLHTRDVPGAHVIVPLAGSRDVDAETLVDAATLAAYHSSVRDEAQVDVGYALRKHLRKPKGAAPGAVMVSNQKTVRVRMEPTRLRRLLDSGEGHRPSVTSYK